MQDRTGKNLRFLEDYCATLMPIKISNTFYRSVLLGQSCIIWNGAMEVYDLCYEPLKLSGLIM